MTEVMTTFIDGYGSVEPRTLANYRWAVGRYESWADAVGVSAHPITAARLLDYCYAHSGIDAWSYSYTKRQINALVWFARTHEGHDPFTPVVRRFLQSVKRQQGKLRAPRVDALSPKDLTSLVTAMRSQRGRHVGPIAAARATVALAVLTERPLWRTSVGGPQSVIAMLARRDIELLESGDLRVRFPDQTLLIDGMRNPELVSQVRAWVEGGPDRLWWETSNKLNHKYLVRRLTTALRAAGVLGDPRDWRTWAALPAEQLQWMLLAMDSGAADGIRNVALLLTGVTLARRHQDLRESNLEHVQATREGYRTLQPRSKTDRQGRGVWKIIGHVRAGTIGQPRTPCDVLCAACALSQYLALERFARSRTTGPLAATRYGGEVRMMTSAGMNAMLRVAAQAAGLDQSLVLSSRTMRVTGITLAKDAGATWEEVRALSDHASNSESLRYVRNLTRTWIVLDDEDPALLR